MCIFIPAITFTSLFVNNNFTVLNSLLQHNLKYTLATRTVAGPSSLFININILSYIIVWSLIKFNHSRLLGELQSRLFTSKCTCWHLSNVVGNACKHTTLWLQMMMDDVLLARSNETACYLMVHVIFRLKIYNKINMISVLLFLIDFYRILGYCNSLKIH